jgi:hypothetical protein
MDLKRLLFTTSILIISILPLKAIASGGDTTGFRWITFKGTSTLTGYLSNRQGTGQEIPAQYLNWQLSGQLVLMGIPFSCSALLSTMQSELRQPINHVSFRLNTRSMMRPGVKVPALRFLSHFETLEFGRTRPEYSKLMLSGIMLNGVNIGIRGGGFSAAFAGGITMHSIHQGTFWGQQYEQKMVFGRIGLGRKDGSSLYISVLKAKEKPEALDGELHQYIQRPDTFIHMADTFFIPADTIPIHHTPSEHLLCGMDGSLVFLRGRLRLEGSLTGCAVTTNLESEALQLDTLPEWLIKVFQPRLTSSVSWAMRFGASFLTKSSRINASFSRTAPGFQTPGVPYLRQDYQGIEVKGSQMLFKRKLSLQPWLRTYRDNLNHQKGATTHAMILGITALWRPLKLPYISITLSPHKQSLSGSGTNQRTTATILTITSGKNYLIDKQYNAFTGITWSNQHMENIRNQDVYHFEGNNFSIQQTLTIKKGISLNASFGCYLLETAPGRQESYQYTAGAAYHCKQKFNAGVGLRYMVQENDRSRIGLTGSLVATLSRYGRLILSAEPLVYRDLLNPEKEYRQYIIRCSLISTF